LPDGKAANVVPVNKLLLAPLLALGLGACTPAQTAIQVPTFEVQSVRLTRLSLPSGPNPALASVTLRLRVGNPNPLPVRLANIAGRLVIDGADVGSVNLPGVNLPARGDTLQDANLSIPVSLQTAGAFLQVARGEQVSYRVDGSFTADLGVLGRPTFGPFTLAQGLWQQPAILPF
jgi:LEA14-like dessication related protein